jgi:hypothetical protein
MRDRSRQAVGSASSRSARGWSSATSPAGQGGELGLNDAHPPNDHGLTATKLRTIPTCEYGELDVFLFLPLRHPPRPVLHLSPLRNLHPIRRLRRRLVFVPYTLFTSKGNLFDPLTTFLNRTSSQLTQYLYRSYRLRRNADLRIRLVSPRLLHLPSDRTRS